jgi:hypothetical protein
MTGDMSIPGSKVSMSEGGSVNSGCHTYTGGVKAGKKHIMRTPQVVAIFWGQNSNDVTPLGQLLSDLITGPFMNGLVQYGVDRGSVTTIPVNDDQNNPAPTTLDKSQVAQQLNKWFQDGTVSPVPAVNETNLLYYLFPPPKTEVKDGDFSTKSPDPNKRICGYHSHARKSHSSSHNDDLFWAIVGTSAAVPGTGKAFANSLAYCVGHELVEALSDRDEQGYKTDNQCEIGDLCETRNASNQDTGNVFRFNYRGWRVEQYWSNWDNTCIQGDQPVSLRKFLGAIGLDGSQGLRGLHTPEISLRYMASRM